MTAHIRRLYDHLVWADTRTLNALRAMHAAPLDALRLYSHLLAAEHVWLARIDDREPEMPVWPALDLDECAALSARNHAAFAVLAETLSTAELERKVHYRNSKGDEFTNTRGRHPDARRAARLVSPRPGGPHRARRGRRSAGRRTTSFSFASEADLVTGAAEPATERPTVFASLGARFLASMLDLVVITIPSLDHLAAARATCRGARVMRWSPRSCHSISS